MPHVSDIIQNRTIFCSLTFCMQHMYHPSCCKCQDVLSSHDKNLSVITSLHIFVTHSFINGHFICLCILSGVSNAALKLAPTLNSFAFLLEIGLIFSIHSNVLFSIKKMIVLCDKNTQKLSEILFKIISVFGMKWFCYSSSIQIRLNLCLSVNCSLQIQLNHKAIQH